MLHKNGRRKPLTDLSSGLSMPTTACSPTYAIHTHTIINKWIFECRTSGLVQICWTQIFLLVLFLQPLETFSCHWSIHSCSVCYSLICSVAHDLIHTRSRKICTEIKIRQSPSICTFSFSCISRLSCWHSSCLKTQSSPHILDESLGMQKNKKKREKESKWSQGKWMPFKLWKQAYFARFRSLCRMPTPLDFYMVLDPLKIGPEKQYVLGLQTQIV